ncbi:uncharacterized protein NPIL_332161 [Nephila pilipes]|uniref:Uncharacterized protein n=1 Tax=Nephila pilipes TaxID=299642 RepID=A0A8X6QDK3_NEPPI|nr:uncharacterized protein NPIL_332161 [Nephila pilipes]
MSDNERLLIEDNSAIGSDSESEISLIDSGSYESSLLDFSSDEETEMLDDFNQVGNFYEIDTSNPPLAPLCFPFTAVDLKIDISHGTLPFLDIFFDDNLLEMIAVKIINMEIDLFETVNYKETAEQENGN